MIDKRELTMARDISLALIQAHGNLIGTVLAMAKELGIPPEVAREFLSRLDAANEATIAATPAKLILANQLATLLERFEASSD